MGTLATRASQSASRRRRQRYREQGKTAEEIAQLEAARRERQQARRDRAEAQQAGLATRDNRPSASTLPVAPGIGSQAAAAQTAGLPGVATEIVSAEEQLTEDMIEEREEILEEAGGNSDPTEELGDDPNEEIKEVKNSLQVLYSFNEVYTDGGFIESLDPDFKRIQVPSGGSPAKKQAIRKVKRQARRAAANCVLIARVTLKSKNTRLQDYKSLSRIDEPVLDLEQRKFIYKPGEKSKLRTILRKQPFPTGSIVQRINSFLDIPEFQRIETPVIINKFEMQNQFRLSPIDDASTQIETQSDSRTPPPPGSYLETISPDVDTFRGVAPASGLSAERAAAQIGSATSRDIDDGLVRDLERDRLFTQQDFRDAADLEFERLDTGGPPIGGNFGGGGGGY